MSDSDATPPPPERPDSPSPEYTDDVAGEAQPNQSQAPASGPDDPRHAGLSSENLAEAKHYGRLSLYCDLADRAIDLAYLAIAAVWLGRPLEAWLAAQPLLAEYRSLRLVALLLLLMAIHMAVSFPLSFFSGHVLEHRFGLSNQSVAGWLWRYTKHNLLGVAFAAVLFLGLFWIIWTTGPWWWLVGTAAFFLVSVVMGRLVPVLILPLFYTVEKLDAPELTERIRRLAEGTGLSIEGVYRLDLSEETRKANAMLAGMGRTRRVLLGDTLLEEFSPEEIEVIFAHEIGHHVHRHIPKLIAAGVVLSLAGFWVCDRLLIEWVSAWQGGFSYAELPVWALPIVIFSLTVFTMVMEPLQNALSRAMERQSDRYALERTGDRAAYESAFRKLARVNKADPDPHRLEVFLFHSHPPLADRLGAVESG